MEFMTSVNKKETLEIGDLLTGSYEGKSVKVNGAGMHCSVYFYTFSLIAAGQ